jgi:hypothetical protein
VRRFNAQKEGTFKIVDNSSKVSKEITGIPEVNDSGQGGLWELLIDPNFVKKPNGILDLFK